jgi:LysR family transcriptional regulator, hydrogen peroxide-inducible genes activator
MTGNPLPFSLRQLQYVRAIAETRNFRQAAERCAVAQPSLSAQLAALEAALGVRFFERDRRGVILTPAGEALLQRVNRVLTEASELREEAKHFRDPLAGPFRLGVIPTMAPYLLPKAVPALREAFPKLVPQWVEDRTATLVAQLQQGRLDGALLALEAELQDLETTTLGRDHFLLAVPKGHAFAKGRKPIRIHALEGERMLLMDDGHCLRHQALAACREVGMEELEFRATSLPTLVQMVASGIGVSLLPEMALAMEAGRASLVLRRLADPVPYRTVVLAWRRGSHAAVALKKIAKLLRNMRHFVQ